MRIDRRTLRWLIIAATDAEDGLPNSYTHSYAMSETKQELASRNERLDEFLQTNGEAEEFELLPVPLPVADGVADEPAEAGATAPAELPTGAAGGLGYAAPREAS